LGVRHSARNESAFGTDVERASPFLTLSDLSFDSVEVSYPILRRPAWLFPPAKVIPNNFVFDERLSMMLPRRALGVLAFAFLGSAANAAAAPISVVYTDPVTNWEWAEVAELKNLFSWDDVNTVCAEDGVTACAGTLEEKEFDGWIWATSDQVSDLFVNATDDLTAAMLGGGLAQVFDSQWAPQFLGLFSPTFEDSVSDWVAGWTADIDPNDATRAYTAFSNIVFPLARPTAWTILILQPLPPSAIGLIPSLAVSGCIVLPRRQSSHPNRRPCCSWAAGSSSASDATGRTVHNGLSVNQTINVREWPLPRELAAVRFRGCGHSVRAVA
jgi:hypothetical protein